MQDETKKDTTNTDDATEEVEEIVPETDVDMGVGKDAATQISKLKEKLKACEKEKQEYLDGWQRARADFVNLRKRDEEEKKEYIKFASERVIDDMIPVLDSFEMAFANKEAWEKADKNWRMGVEYIHSQLRAILEKNGLVDINPIGQTFDVNRDEASEYVPVENEFENNKIIAVVQRGYMLNGKMLRPAKVKVGEKK